MYYADMLQRLKHQKYLMMILFTRPDYWSFLYFT